MVVIISKRYTAGSFNRPMVDFSVEINGEKFAGSGCWHRDSGWALSYESAHNGLVSDTNDLVALKTETREKLSLALKSAVYAYDASLKPTRSV